MSAAYDSGTLQPGQLFDTILSRIAEQGERPVWISLVPRVLIDERLADIDRRKQAGVFFHQEQVRLTRSSGGGNPREVAVAALRANTLEELTKKLDDVNAERALATITAYNKAVRTDVPFNPNVKDGR